MLMPNNANESRPRRFEFARDTFAFANETYWEYHFDDAAGKTSFTQREPKPDYAHRCFVLTRAARQFLYHARFDENSSAPTDGECRRLIAAVMARNPRVPCVIEKEIAISGYASLREFSGARSALLKAGCGGAWQSYVLRSHWRMVFPISRAHQARTATSLNTALSQNIPPVVHLIKFPALTINHSMVLFSAEETAEGFAFKAYDPNQPQQPVTIVYSRASREFSLSRNHYWAGGVLDVIKIYQNWLM
jgi:hypothetical protein